MKISIPVKRDDNLEDHFGKCEYYKIYSVSDNNEIQDIQTIDSDKSCGCKSNIASVLAKAGVTIMLAGGIGNGAINVLNRSGIEVIRGCSGNASAIVNLYISGLLIDSGESCRQHEQHYESGHENDHTCNH